MDGGPKAFIIPSLKVTGSYSSHPSIIKIRIAADFIRPHAISLELMYAKRVVDE